MHNFTDPESAWLISWKNPLVFEDQELGAVGPPGADEEAIALLKAGGG